MYVTYDMFSNQDPYFYICNVYLDFWILYIDIKELKNND